MQDAARIHVDHDGGRNGAAARSGLWLGKCTGRRHSHREREHERNRPPRARALLNPKITLPEIHPVLEGRLASPPSLSNLPKRHPSDTSFVATCWRDWVRKKAKIRRLPKR
jgi:hypothetical protein